VIPKFTNDYYSAELQNTNLAGTSYVLYDLNGNERQQLAAILYVYRNFIFLVNILSKYRNQIFLV
jgi:hypothetical protein